MKNVLIAGASRGIGLELAVQYAADDCHVVAGCRQPDDARKWLPPAVDLQELDVTRIESVAALAWHCDDMPLSLMVIAAGVQGPTMEHFLAPGDQDFDTVMHTNVLGAMRLIQAFAPSVARTHGRIVVLSSHLGSLAGTHVATQPLYRASIAAANMVTRMAAAAYRSAGITVTSIDPGSVRTDMGGPQAELGVAEAVDTLRGLIDSLDPAHNGHFIDLGGHTLAW
ncbi:MAG: SDR family NAD(P)-dependent oxidoreductase [Rhodocyclaceae bacterium]